MHFVPCILFDRFPVTTGLFQAVTLFFVSFCCNVVGFNGCKETKAIKVTYKVAFAFVDEVGHLILFGFSLFRYDGVIEQRVATHLRSLDAVVAVYIFIFLGGNSEV